MHPEIEKLIDLAIADGQITEKERNVILRKAVELGQDQDEVEMFLDGQLHQMLNQNQKSIKEKVGIIKTCPACGASVKAMSLVCADCGHEFANTSANYTILELIEKLEKIDSSQNDAFPKSTGSRISDSAQRNEHEQNKNLMKSELIKNFPIPNNKGDIVEFLSYSLSKAKDSSYVSYFGDQHSLSGAWRIKADELIIKAKILFKDDMIFLAQMNAIEKDLKSFLRSRTIKLVFVLGVIAIIIIGIVISSIINSK